MQVLYEYNLCDWNTTKEKHSLMRKLVGYRNWRQRWKGSSFLGKENKFLWQHFITDCFRNPYM